MSEDSLQWLLERKVSEPRKKASGWKAVSFAHTRVGLLLSIGRNCGPIDPAILDAVRALPAHHAPGSLSSLEYPTHHQGQKTPSARVNEASEGHQITTVAVALWPIHGNAYAITLGDEVIVPRSRAPERDAARELQRLGFSGPFETIDCQTGQTRMRFPDIARAAR